MKKCCDQYPDCIHHFEWYKPALDINNEKKIAEKFLIVMYEATKPILENPINEDNYKSTLESLKQNFEILPDYLHRLFVEKTIDLIRRSVVQEHILTKHFEGIKYELYRSVPIIYNNYDYNSLDELETIALTEWWLELMNTEFEKILTPTYFEPLPYWIVDETDKSEKFGIALRNWYFLSEIPFFNFSEFQKKVRKLKLSTQISKDGLKEHLNKCFQVSYENCILYKDFIDPLSLVYCKAKQSDILPDELKEFQVGMKPERYTLKVDNGEYSKWQKIPPFKRFDVQNPRSFSYTHFVEFSQQVFNFLNNDIFQIRIEDIEANGIEKLIYPENNTTTEPIEKSQTRKLIEKEFGKIDINRGWEYAFFSEPDYNTFVDLLTLFFESKPYNLPQKCIKLKKSTKTRFAKALSTIYKECAEKKLKSDTDFFKIIKILNHFENSTDNEIYAAITR